MSKICPGSRVTGGGDSAAAVKASRKKEAIWRRRVLACVLLIAIRAGRADAQTPVLLGFMESDIRLAVRHAVEGAAARLACSGCQDLFSDFTDQVGQRLSTTLAASGKSSTEAFAVLRFVDDDAAPQCRAGMTLAFTQTGSRLIRICGPQFREQFLQNRSTTEIILIHESLHALGVGENPPTSDVITERLARRCGG